MSSPEDLEETAAIRRSLSSEEDAILRDIDQNMKTNRPDARQGLPLINETRLRKRVPSPVPNDLWKKRRKIRLKRERREKIAAGAIIGFSLLWIGLWLGLLAGAVVLVWRVVIG